MVLLSGKEAPAGQATVVLNRNFLGVLGGHGAGDG
jgi:hypothetical protein